MMIKNKIAILSDIHIGSHNNSELWQKTTTDFFDFFVDKLKKDNISDVVICGDINDNRSEVSLTSLNTLKDICIKLKDFNVNLIVGNHDSYYKNTSDINSISLLNEWDNINVISSPKTIKHNNKVITFCPWGVDVNTLPQSDYLFGHFEINGFKLNKNRVCTNGKASTLFLNKADTVISGHFHLRTLHEYDNKKILYVGSPYELNWGDADTVSRGFYYLDINTNSLEFIENKISPQHKTVRLSEIDSVDKKELKSRFKNNFIKFVVDKDIENFDIINKLLILFNKYGAIDIKTEYELINNKNTITDVDYNVSVVDIKDSILEFIDITDYEKKNLIIDKTVEIYELCKNNIKEAINNKQDE